MTIALIVPPASEPLGLREIKDHLRIDHDHEDALLIDTLAAARQYTEFATGQKFITQIWRQYESEIPASREIALRVAPVQGVQIITGFDAEGDPNILAAQDARILQGRDGSVLAIDDRVPIERCANGLEIDLLAGFGDHAVDVSHTLKRAMLLLVAHWYEFRGAVSPQDQPVSLPPGFDALVAPYKRHRL